MGKEREGGRERERDGSAMKQRNVRGEEQCPETNGFQKSDRGAVVGSQGVTRLVEAQFKVRHRERKVGKNNKKGVGDWVKICGREMCGLVFWKREKKERKKERKKEKRRRGQKSNESVEREMQRERRKKSLHSITPTSQLPSVFFFLSFFSFFSRLSY